MWIKPPSIHVGLQSNEAESDPFSLPSHDSQRGYSINIAAKTACVPAKLVLQKAVPDELDSAKMQWETIYVWEKDNQQSLYNCTRRKDSDSGGAPRVWGGEQQYKIVADKPGVIVYFTAHELQSAYTDINKDIVDYVCFMNESIEKVIQLVENVQSDVEDISSRIRTLERCIIEGEDDSDA